MKKIIIDGKHLTIEDVILAVRGGAEVILSKKSQKLVGRGRKQLKKQLDQGKIIYGVTTGFGKNVSFIIPPEDRVQLQKNLIWSLNCGTSPFFPKNISRAALLICLNYLARGYSGVRSDLLLKVYELAKKGAAPKNPKYGSCGASGDLVPNSYTARLIMKEIDPQAKEGLAIINNVGLTAAVAVFNCYDFEYLFLLGLVCEALYTEVLKGKTGPLNPLPHQLRGDSGQLFVAQYLRNLMAGSRLVQDYEEAAKRIAAKLKDGIEPGEDIQDAYSLRAAPQGLGPLWRAYQVVKNEINQELNSAGDNPLIDPYSGEIVHNANFLGVRPGFWMDTMKIVNSYFAVWLQAIQERVIDSKKNNGLPANLVLEPGLNSGFKGVGLSVAGYVADICQKSTSHLIFSRSTECDNQDVVSFCLGSARVAREQITLLREVLARVLLTLCQAADFRGPEKLAPKTRKIYDQIRSYVEFIKEDGLGLDRKITRIRKLIKNHEIKLPICKG